MQVNDLIAALSARADELNNWVFEVEAALDDEGDGTVTLTVGYEEKHKYTFEPWDAFGPFPIECSASGMGNNQRQTVYQWVKWDIINGAVA